MLLFTIVGVGIMLFGNTNTETKYYAFCVWLGLGTGYWAMFVTLAGEQFGTNIRNTATTTVPNMVRGLVPVMILAFDFSKRFLSHYKCRYCRYYSLWSGILLNAYYIGNPQ